MAKEEATVTIDTDEMSKEDYMEVKGTRFDDQEFVEKAGIAVYDWFGYSGTGGVPVKSTEVYDDNLARYEQHPLLFACVNIRATFSVGSGFELQCKHKGTLGWMISQFRRLGILYADNTVSEMMMDVPKRMDVYGNEYWETVWGNKELSQIRPINARHIKPTINEKGDVVGYAYTPVKKGQPAKVVKTIPLTLEQVAHFVSDTVEHSAIGMSKIFPAKREIDAGIQVADISVTLIKKYVKPMLHFIYHKDEREQAKQVGQQIQRLVTYLKDHKQESDFISSDKWEVKPMKSTFQMDQINLFLGRMYDNILAALEVPDSFFTAKGTTDLKVTQQIQNFKKIMQGRQRYVGQILTEKIIHPMLEKKFGTPIDSIPENKIPVIVWNDVVDTDLVEFAKASALLYEKNVLERDESRDILGFGPGEEDLEEKLKEAPKPEQPEEEQPEEEEPEEEEK